MRRSLGAFALLLGAALATYPIVRTGELTGIALVGGGGFAFLLLALTSSLARWLLVPSVALLALHYPLSLHTAGMATDVYALAFGAGLFLSYEAANLSVDLADVAPSTRPALAYRVRQALALAAGGCIVGVIALVAPSVGSGGTVLVLVGAACVLGLVALPLSIARRGDSQEEVTGGHVVPALVRRRP